ncbi:peptide-methionine (S)-S-oxide reductase [Candidatus Wolfebacteria bacterium]|nr:MAG: peptide-methionine (S)-S-oxide reductase [Candidatus Wolfebacteria bacterium]
MNKKATFGAGCFWSVEERFSLLKGVVETEVGYAGGPDGHVTYEQVCTGGTGHAEVVHITYNPDIITYEELLEEFWKMHDPTQLNKQGPDIGSQYRSIIFYHTDDQKEIAEKSFKEKDESGKFDDPIVTAIEPAGHFCRAEEYHQDFNRKNGRHCKI